MNIISTNNFKHTIKDIYDKAEDRKFCFILGAGASKSSGIPMGGDLAHQWYDDISKRYSKEELTRWIHSAGIDTQNLAPSYGPIYRERFKTDKTSGYEYLVDVMKDANPSFGHIVLAKFLSVSKGHCVLTTNFDSLIESAIYQFTHETPLVCGHESLSGYAKASKIHPLIIKIHRDLLMAPKSLPKEIGAIDQGWVEPLDRIFSTHIPIIIGYGGNDGSLMTYFKNMKKPSNFFWCGMNEKSISTEITELVRKMEGSFVKIDGFDELMHQLLFVFSDIGPLDKELNNITQNRVDRFNKQLRDITEKQQHIEHISDDIADYDTELSALEFYNKAMAEMDFDKREAIFQQAVDTYPETSWLWSNFIYFLQFEKRDYSKLDDFFAKALEVDPEDYFLNGNYAIYLKDVKRDLAEANKYYLKTISIEPNNAIALSNYALFLDTVYKRYDEAEEYYKRALKSEPDNPTALNAYADYFCHVKKDHVKAEELFLKSLEIDPDNAATLSGYASLLKNIKKDPDRANELYQKALLADPNDPIANSSYASFLTHNTKRYDEAETYFLKAIKYAAAKENHMANYCQLLYIQGRKKEAKTFVDKAMKLNGDRRNELLIEVYFYLYAHEDGKAESELIIKELLAADVKSVGWDFSKNIEIAIANGHPDPEKLKDYAAAIGAIA